MTLLLQEKGYFSILGNGLLLYSRKRVTSVFQEKGYFRIPGNKFLWLQEKSYFNPRKIRGDRSPSRPQRWNKPHAPTGGTDAQKRGE